MAKFIVSMIFSLSAIVPFSAVGAEGEVAPTVALGPDQLRSIESEPNASQAYMVMRLRLIFFWSSPIVMTLENLGDLDENPSSGDVRRAVLPFLTFFDSELGKEQRARSPNIKRRKELELMGNIEKAMEEMEPQAAKETIADLLYRHHRDELPVMTHFSCEAFSREVKQARLDFPPFLEELANLPEAPERGALTARIKDFFTAHPFAYLPLARQQGDPQEAIQWGRALEKKWDNAR